MKQKTIFSFLGSLPRIFSLFIMCLLWQNPAQAMLVKPINMNQLTHLAKYIVKAEVVGKQTELDTYESGRMVTYYTLHVEEWLKGKSWDNDDKVIIKQLAHGEFKVGDSVVRQNLFFPQYEVGQRYVFFLPNPHPKTGLLIPIGAEQGRFRIVKDKDGNDTVPELKDRAAFLRKNLDDKPSGQFLKLQLNATKEKDIDTTYSNFKKIVDTAGQAE